MSIILETRYDGDLPQLQHLTLIWRLDDDELHDTTPADADILTGIELGRLEAWRYNYPFFDPFDVSDVAMHLDDRCVDLGAIAADLEDHEEKLRSILGDEIDDPLQALLITHRLNVPARFRGKRLGVKLMKALQVFHAGFPCIHALHAVPMELRRDDPGYPALQRRLAAYYLSEPTLRLVQVAPKRDPTFMVAHWSGERLEPPDFILDYGEVATIVRANSRGTEMERVE